MALPLLPLQSPLLRRGRDRRSAATVSFIGIVGTVGFGLVVSFVLLRWFLDHPVEVEVTEKDED